MKFDCVVMNPPYQTKSDIKNEKTQPVWDKFIEKALSICKDDGFLASVNPSGWRSTGDIFDAAKIIKEKQIEYLEIHNEQDGIKTFGATTRYDWYVLRNSKISTFSSPFFAKKDTTLSILALGINGIFLKSTSKTFPS